MLRTLILFSIFVICAFLVGLYWSVVSTLMGPTLSYIGVRLVALDAYLTNHQLPAGFIFAFVGVIILPLFHLIRKFMTKIFSSKTIIDLFCNDESHVYIVTAHMRQNSFTRISDQRQIVLPANTPFLPSNIAVSATLIFRYTFDKYGDSRTAILHFDSDNWGADRHSFLCIGGPFVNEIVDEIIKLNIIPNFAVTDVPEINDNGAIFVAKRASAAPNADLEIDYGVIVCVKNPKNPAKRIMFLFGLWPPGTQAAVDIILNVDAKPADQFKKLRQAVRRGNNVIAIVKVDVTGLILSRGELVQVRTF